MGVLIKNKINYSGGKLLMSPECYSLEEQEIGCWTDGKPLYQKTYYCNPKVSISANSWGNIATISEVVNVIKSEAVNNDNGEYAYYAVAGSCSSSKVLSILNPRSNTGIQVEWVTFYYTKPTDTPGSGTWTPSGVKTEHYSENEQVVGTWIDGSPIYEKTIDLGSESMWGWTSGFYLNSYIPSNIDQIISSTGYSATYKCSYPIMILKENDNWNGYTYNGSFIKIITLQYTKSSS